MNPWAILGAVVLAGAALGGSYWQGRQDGRDSEIARLSEIKDAIQQAKDAAQEGTAHAIAQAKQDGVRVVTQVKTVTRDVPVYRSADCQHDQRVFDTLNDALRGGTPGDRGMPGGSGGAAGQVDGRDDGQAR